MRKVRGITIRKWKSLLYLSVWIGDFYQFYR